jgi:hypothetical protein
MPWLSLIPILAPGLAALLVLGCVMIGGRS